MGSAALAAQYLRMSTDMQKYSLENQRAVIRVYAARNNLTIIRSYEDSGKSGLTITRRIALKGLLDDVQSGRADFNTILVYDVSRWGRFQDTDESAYYEFVCKQAGVQVQYCAEQFDNDGSPTAAILKSVKRAMAGEFSRELSVRVFNGQSRIVQNGFYVGSAPGFGLRRYLVGPDGLPSRPLESGERKSIQGEHTILVPGPTAEVQIIRRVYDLFIDRKMSINAIAARLNAEGSVTWLGRPWAFHSVRELLTNEKYCGSSIYARTSKKFGRNWRKNDPHDWIRCRNAFAPVVTSERFAEARHQLQENSRRISDSEILDRLTAIWCKLGRLHIDLIQACETAPAIKTIQQRFGGLTHAYRKLGYRGRARRDVNIDMRKAVRADITEQVVASGGTVRTAPDGRDLLINGTVQLAVGVGRTPRSSMGQNRWQFGYRSSKKPDVLVIARVGDSGVAARDYFVLPL